MSVDGGCIEYHGLWDDDASNRIRVRLQDLGVEEFRPGPDGSLPTVKLWFDRAVNLNGRAIRAGGCRDELHFANEAEARNMIQKLLASGASRHIGP